MSADSINGGGFVSGIAFSGADGKVYGDQTIAGDAEVPADKTLTVQSGAKLTIPTDATLDSENGTIVNNGLVMLASGVEIASLNMSGDGQVEQDGNTYDNRGTPTGGGTIPDKPVSVDMYISEDKQPALPDSDKINTDGKSESITRSSDVIAAAPSLESAIDKADTPYGSKPTVSSDVAVSLATEFLVESGVIAPDGGTSSGGACSAGAAAFVALAALAVIKRRSR